MNSYRDEMKDMSFSFMGKGSILVGKFSLKGSTHLASHLEGELTMEDGGTLIIEPDGSFDGILRGRDIEIFGHFKGSLVSDGKVIIHSCASITGDIEAAHLIIRPGAIVNIEGRTLH